MHFSGLIVYFAILQSLNNQTERLRSLYSNFVRPEIISWKLLLVFPAGQSKKRNEIIGVSIKSSVVVKRNKHGGRLLLREEMYLKMI